MGRDILIGVDVGTQGTKAAVFTNEGRQLSSAFRPSHLINPSPGVVEQDSQEMYAEFLGAVSEAVQASGVAPGDVAAIGLDGQMAGILGIDGDYNAVTHYDSWLDTRCSKYIERIKRTDEKKVIQTTGVPVTVAHGPKVLWWKHERPEVYRKIAKFVLPTAYIAGRLTGLKSDGAYIDYTDIHFSGFADTEKMQWSDELLGLFDVEKEKLPPIVEPWKVVGRLTKEAAAELGLISGIPVVAGCGDQAATSLGAGVTRKGVVFDVAGTASVFSCCADRYSPDVEHKTLLFPRSVLPGLWIPLAYISGGGLCLRWYKDNVLGGVYSYDELNAEAESVALGSEGLLFVPHFSGRTCPNDPSLGGTWMGLNWMHERKHLYRSIMESIAYEYASYLKILRNSISGFSPTHVVSIGGGSKSRLFGQIKADVLGIPYKVLENSDTATFGSAVTAGYGVGLYDDLAKAVEDAVVMREGQIEPSADNHRFYEKYVLNYETLLDSLSSVYGKLK